MKEMAEHEFPVTLGRDFAGVVEQVGSGVSGYRAGDEVFGFVLHADPAVQDGSWAELITISEEIVAQKPRSLDFAQAGAAPLAAISALAAFDALAPAAGETVLVVGAPGGVGSFFVQLAADAGRTAATRRAPRQRNASGLAPAPLRARPGRRRARGAADDPHAGQARRDDRVALTLGRCAQSWCRQARDGASGTSSFSPGRRTRRGSTSP